MEEKNAMEKLVDRKGKKGKIMVIALVIILLSAISVVLLFSKPAFAGIPFVVPLMVALGLIITRDN